MGVTCVWGVVFQAVFLGTFVARAVLGVLADEWTYVAIELLGLDFFMLLAGASAVFRQRVRESERATLLRQNS